MWFKPVWRNLWRDFCWRLLLHLWPPPPGQTLALSSSWKFYFFHLKQCNFSLAFMSFFCVGLLSRKILQHIAPRCIQFQYHTGHASFCQCTYLAQKKKNEIFCLIKNASDGVHELFWILEIINRDAFWSVIANLYVPASRYVICSHLYSAGEHLSRFIWLQLSLVFPL